MSGPFSVSGPPPAVLHHPGFNLHADQGDKILGTMIALIILATTFVLLRLISRHLARAGFWWDDVLVVTALLLAIVPCICNIVAVKHVGFGQHIYVFGNIGGMEAATSYFHILYFFQLFFTLATGVIKLAILAFYRRIFPIAELKLILIVITALVVMYTVAVSTLNIFQCHPIRKSWEHEQPGYCINPVTSLIASGSVNTVLDFMVVFLPVPLLWRLRTSTRQKSILTGIFLTAGFVCIVSIVRLISYTMVDPNDITWDLVGVSIWSAVEPIIGILGACLPSLRPLVTLLLHNDAYRSFAASTSKTFQSGTSSVLKNNQSKSKNRNATTFARLEENDGNAKAQRLPWRDRKAPRVYDNETDGHNITVYGGRGQPVRDGGDAIEMEERMSDVEPPKGVIRVKTEILLSSSKRLDYNDRLY